MGLGKEAGPAHHVGELLVLVVVLAEGHLAGAVGGILLRVSGGGGLDPL